MLSFLVGRGHSSEVCTLGPLIAETQGCGCPLSKHSCFVYVPRLVPQEHLVFCFS